MSRRSISVLALDVDGVLTDGRVLWDAEGREQKALCMRDIDAVFEARRRGLAIALVTGEATPWAEFLVRRLEVRDAWLGAKDKLAALREVSARLRTPLAAIAYVGDGDRDAPALAAAGVGMAPADATPLARGAAGIVLKARGGNGAVREACERLGWLERGAARPRRGQSS